MSCHQLRHCKTAISRWHVVMALSVIVQIASLPVRVADAAGAPNLHETMLY